nr:DNA mismatch repair protein MLH1 isoform X4 [Ipomoea batatas]
MSLSSLLCSVSSSSTPDSGRRRRLWLWMFRQFSSHGFFSGEIKETKSGLKMMNTSLLKQKAKMLEEYFNIYIDSNGNLSRLPVLLDQYTPDMDHVLEFVLCLGNDVGDGSQLYMKGTSSSSINGQGNSSKTTGRVILHSHAVALLRNSTAHVAVVSTPGLQRLCPTPLLSSSAAWVAVQPHRLHPHRRRALSPSR